MMKIVPVSKLLVKYDIVFLEDCNNPHSLHLQTLETAKQITNKFKLFNFLSSGQMWPCDWLNHFLILSSLQTSMSVTATMAGVITDA